MQEYRTRLQDGGRLVIPVDCRRILNLSPGEKMVLRVWDGELRLHPARDALARAQQLMKKHRVSASAVDELIAGRRQEAERE